MKKKKYFLITAILFSAIGFIHLLRVLLGWEAVVGGWTVPMWFSVVAILLTGFLAYHGFRSYKK